MSIERLQKLLNSEKTCVRINRNLLKNLDVEEAVLYSYLVSEYAKSLKCETYKNFNKENNKEKYFFCPVEDVERNINFSAFRQRNALLKLQNRGLLNIKFGHSRARYISINEDTSILEQLLFGITTAELETKFMKFLKQQVSTFTEENDIPQESKYILNYIISSSNNDANLW